MINMPRDYKLFMIQYEPAPDIENRVRKVAHKLGFDHIDLSRVACVRSRGSKTRYTIARCHALGKIWQKAIGIKAHYVIEVISEKFDSIGFEEQTKVIIHELMHIPHTFGGGFRHHKPYVNRQTVEMAYRKYKSLEQL